MHRLTLLIVAALAVVLLMTAIGCDDGQTSVASQQRKASVQTRAATFARAEAKYPLPRVENFPLRDLLVEMTKREDLVNHPWYTYVIADTGQTLGYYVTKTPPINKCNFLSSTEDITKTDFGEGWSSHVLTAPSLDGIYYGGGGASGACNQWVMQDYSTGALITLGDVKYFVADRPLNLDAEPIRVEK